MSVRTVELSPEAIEALRHASTATLSTQLLRRGFRNTFIRGLVPTRPGLRLVGYAFTIVLVMTLSWVFGSDSPGVSAAGLPWLGG